MIPLYDTASTCICAAVGYLAINAAIAASADGLFTVLETIAICFPAAAALFKASITVASNVDQSTSLPSYCGFCNLDISYKSKTTAAVVASVPWFKPIEFGFAAREIGRPSRVLTNTL